VVQVRTVSAQELKRLPFRDAPHRLDVLSRLPSVISSAANDSELFLHLANLLLSGIPRADAVALVAVAEDSTRGPVVKILHREQRLAIQGEFRPSRGLVLEALQRLQKTVLHVWGNDDAGAPAYTLQGNFDWAYCVPVPGEACKGWGIYVTGRFSGDAATVLAPWESNDLRDDLKFTELVASVLSSLRQVKQLQQQQALLGHFFSPGVLEVLTSGADEQALKPRETEVTVLFCDLRGFSRKVETSSADLFAVLDRVSRALGVMTQNILDRKGVVADFQGDAAMSFWGWPLTQPDKVQLACQAALGIRNQFEAFARDPHHPLANFQAGIGVATGRAVAGRIGTAEQAKVTVFGPVVNLAARLEGMTKILRVPILLDAATAKVVRAQMPRTEARVRRMALVKPYGLDTPLIVSELLPPADQYPVLSDEHLAHYEAALDALLQGDWARAYELLHLVPPQDLGKDFLTGFIIQHGHIPPPGWKESGGVITLTSKS
jgi:adenylate cyclase